MKSRVELSWPHQLGHIAKEHREQTHVWWGTITAVQSELAKNISASRMRGCVIVENNVINQKVIGMMLAKLGLTYTVAENGHVALQHHRRRWLGKSSSDGLPAASIGGIRGHKADSSMGS